MYEAKEAGRNAGALILHRRRRRRSAYRNISSGKTPAGGRWKTTVSAVLASRCYAWRTIHRVTRRCCGWRIVTTAHQLRAFLESRSASDLPCRSTTWSIRKAVRKGPPASPDATLWVSLTCPARRWKIAKLFDIQRPRSRKVGSCDRPSSISRSTEQRKGIPGQVAPWE